MLYLYKEMFTKFYFFLVHHLSRIKYHIEFAKGSTIASVKAIKNETSAINIKQVMAIMKWPIVYIIVLTKEPFDSLRKSMLVSNKPLVNSVNFYPF